MILKSFIFIGLMTVVQAQQIIPPMLNYSELQVVSPWQDYTFRAHSAASKDISFRFIDPASCQNVVPGIETTVDFLIDGQQVHYANGTFVALRGLTKVWVWSEGDIIKLCGAPWEYGDDFSKRRVNRHQIGLSVQFDRERNGYVATNIGCVGPTQQIVLTHPNYTY